MLKTLKWVYDLGIRHERVRIAGHLQITQGSLRMERDTMLDMMRADPAPSKTRKEKLQFQTAVNDRVAQIIDDIMRPEEHHEYGASIMFPDKLTNKEN